MKKVLVVGASGATGKLVVAQLLKKNIKVLAIVRTSSTLTKIFGNDDNYREVIANISDLCQQELVSHLDGCDGIVSCLGHNLSFKGVYGEPRRLVTDTIKKLTMAIESMSMSDKVKLVLMNTTGNSNRDIPEKPPLSQRIVVSMLRTLLPPHVDNEQAADVLRQDVGQGNKFLEWVIVRPDSLTEEAQVSPYKIFASPTRNAIFDAGSTSRQNVANFMVELLTSASLWSKWQGRMPVIYNDN